jgi:hypothetical protein
MFGIGHPAAASRGQVVGAGPPLTRCAATAGFALLGAVLALFPYALGNRVPEPTGWHYRYI